MTRRVTVHKSRTKENELLTVVTVYEPGINKERIKQMNRYSKRHHVLVPYRNNYKWLR